MQDRYINSELYDLAVSDLETIARTFEPAAPDDLRTRIIEVLGDLGMWPIDCQYRQQAVLPHVAA
ncbi:hypothetical protein [Agrobacterium cavarae]|uniref:hypothetical protein n=1 Tax=Agrobacterium cavarae TaxID=2528239 RepID=UPI003FD3919B